MIIKYSATRALLLVSAFVVSLAITKPVIEESLEASTEYNENKKEQPLEEDYLYELVDVVNYVPDEILTDNHIGDIHINYVYSNNAFVEDTLSVEDFLYYDKTPSKETVDKIRTIHIPELSKFNYCVNNNLIINSAARAYDWEISQKRSGNGQHVYANGFGAVDVAIKEDNHCRLRDLEEYLIKKTKYNRIARYKSFIHVDFKETKQGGRGYYKNTKDGWIYIGKIK